MHPYVLLCKTWGGGTLESSVAQRLINIIAVYQRHILLDSSCNVKLQRSIDHRACLTHRRKLSVVVEGGFFLRASRRVSILFIELCGMLASCNKSFEIYIRPLRVILSGTADGEFPKYFDFAS